MASLGSDLAYLRAKITGGAQVYDSHLNIGQRTSQEVIRQLIDNKIFIAATDIGGRVSRTARFNSFTGDLQITTSEQKTYCI
jgi:chemotaxis protein CheD